MFSAKLTNLDLLKESMSAVAEIIDETDLLVQSDGIRMLAADRAVVAVVDFWLGREAFAEYNFTTEQRIGVNLINFLRVLRRAGPSDVLSISLSGNHLELQIVGDSKRTFNLPIIDVSKTELPPLDKLDFTTSFEVTSDTLSSGIEDADLITDSLVFAANSEKVSLHATSDSASFNLELPMGSPGLKYLDGAKAARSRYSLDYLKRIMKARKLADTARISLATEYPMRMVFEVPGMARLAFIVAPRREE